MYKTPCCDEGLTEIYLDNNKEVVRAFFLLPHFTLCVHRRSLKNVMENKSPTSTDGDNLLKQLHADVTRDPYDQESLIKLFDIYVQQKKDYANGIVWVTQLLNIDPTNPRYLRCLAESQFMAGRLDDSIETFELLLVIEPTDHAALAHLGNAYARVGNLNAAAEVLHRACKVAENQGDSPSCLLYSKDLAEIIRALRATGWCGKEEVVTLPDDYQTCFARSQQYIKQYELIKAKQCLQHSIELLQRAPYAPVDHKATVLYVLATVEEEFQKYQEAFNHFREASELVPENTMYLAGRLHDAARLCMWSEVKQYAPALLSRLDKENIHDVHPASMVIYGASAEQIFKQAKRHGQHLITTALPRPDQGLGSAGYIHGKRSIRDVTLNLPAQQRDPGGRLHIGYVSGNFINHVQGYQVLCFFQWHDRRRFKISVYSLRTPRDEAGRYIQDSIRKQVDTWVDASRMENHDVAQRISEDGVDILVDMMGLVDNPRLGIFAHRPCSVQVGFLGYPGTCGVPGLLDYYIADQTSVPPSHEKYFTEKIVRLPWTYQVTEHKFIHPVKVTTAPGEKEREGAAVGSWEHVCLPPDLISDRGFLPKKGTDIDLVFCNFNNNFKLDPETFATWMRILQSVPRSVLWLLDYPPVNSARLREYAQSQGVDPSRLYFAPFAPKRVHLARVHQYADVFLDTLLCGAHASAGDTLWAGIPILTVCGNTVPSRVCSSMIQATALPQLVDECIVSDLQEYEKRAVDWGLHPEKLHSLQDMIRQHRNTMPLFDTTQYVTHLESGFKAMWDKRSAKEPPSSFSVESFGRITSPFSSVGPLAPSKKSKIN